MLFPCMFRHVSSVAYSTETFPDRYRISLIQNNRSQKHFNFKSNFSGRSSLKNKAKLRRVHCTSQLPTFIKHLVGNSLSDFEIIKQNFVNGGKLAGNFEALESSASTLLQKANHFLETKYINVDNVKLAEKVQVLESSASNLLQTANHFVENKHLTEYLVKRIELVESSASILLQKVLIGNTSYLSGSQSTVEFSHSVVNLVETFRVLSVYLGLQIVNLLAGIVDDPQKFGAIGGKIASGLGIYSGNIGLAPAPVATTALATLAGSVALSAISSKKNISEGGDPLPLRYDPQAVAAYFENRPLDIVSRMIEVTVDCSYLAFNLAVDAATGMIKENEKQRAAEFVDLMTRLGPTTIKIGQALSIRPDILPVTYLEELQKLQDKVPSFSNELAKQLIAEGLGRPVEEVLAELSSEPVAAASLGQVYKGTLRDTGEVVAVKVQRPGVLEGISRDLFLLRNVAQALQSLPSVQSDLVALIDNWAFRFFDELDYVQEGANGKQFAENMKSLKNIKVPRVFLQYTSRKVLITEWVEGDKLSETRESDLLLLVNTALNCYLMQLLESGFLHADPHPGNLLRTSDGCLCVLDYGLMTQVTEDQRYTFIDYISHLVNSDYEKATDDLVRLGFVPPEHVDPVKTAEVVPQLSRILGQLTQEGGAQKVNFQQVSDDLAKISEDYVFVIPPYFALILKVFSVLEGIGLKADPDYAIIKDCYPYLSKRLVTDDSPRTRATLKYFLYGDSNRLNVKRIEDIMGGFTTFQKLTSAPTTSNESGRLLAPIDPVTKEFLSLLFAPQGSFLQELLLTELVCAVDALSRAALAELWRFFASQSSIPLFSDFFAPMSWPIPWSSMFFDSRRVVSLSEEDEYSLDTVKRIWTLIEPQLMQPSVFSGVSDLVRGVIPLMPDLYPGILTTSQRFILMLLQRKALRLADDLDGKNSIMVWERDPVAFARHSRLDQLLFLAPKRDQNP